MLKVDEFNFGNLLHNCWHPSEHKEEPSTMAFLNKAKDLAPTLSMVILANKTVGVTESYNYFLCNELYL